MNLDGFSKESIEQEKQRSNDLIRTFSKKEQDHRTVIEAICDQLPGAILYDGYEWNAAIGQKCYGICYHDKIRVIEIAASLGLKNASYDQFGKEYIVYWRTNDFQRNL